MLDAMTHQASVHTPPQPVRGVLTSVPEVTVCFWVIKILCTTVGETVADHLSGTLGLGLTYTSYLMTGLLVVALAVQLAVRRYVPTVYWVCVVVISVVGILLTDNLTDSLGMPILVATGVCASLLSGTLIAWYAAENTLSIHSIGTRRREVFYWLTVLFAFALGAAAGDLLAEQLRLGDGVAGLVLGSVVVAATLAWWKLGVKTVLAFWVAYVLTGPLGTSIGDLTSQPTSEGGLGLGTPGTSLLFLAAILVLVAYLSITRRDSGRYPPPAATPRSEPHR